MSYQVWIDRLPCGRCDRDTDCEVMALWFGISAVQYRCLNCMVWHLSLDQSLDSEPHYQAASA